MSGVVKLALSYDMFLLPDMYTDKILRPVQDDEKVEISSGATTRNERRGRLTVAIRTIGIRIDKSQDRNSKLQFELAQKQTRSDVRLSFGGDNDARVLIVESVFREPHERRVLLHKEDKGSIALKIRDHIHKRRNGFSPDTHASAVNQVTSCEDRRKSLETAISITFMIQG